MTTSHPPLPRPVDDQLVSFRPEHLNIGLESITGTTRFNGVEADA